MQEDDTGLKNLWGVTWSPGVWLEAWRLQF